MIMDVEAYGAYGCLPLAESDNSTRRRVDELWRWGYRPMVARDITHGGIMALAMNHDCWDMVHVLPVAEAYQEVWLSSAVIDPVTGNLWVTIEQHGEDRSMTGESFEIPRLNDVWVHEFAVPQGYNYNVQRHLER